MFRLIEIFIFEVLSYVMTYRVADIGQYTIYILISLVVSLIPFLVEINFNRKLKGITFNEEEFEKYKIKQKKFTNILWISILLIFIVLILLDNNFIISLPAVIYSLSIYLRLEITVTSIIVPLIFGKYKILLILILAIYFSYRDKEFNKVYEDKIKLSDLYRENKYLNLKIRSEEEEKIESSKKIATLNERNRISRSLHDSIGHTISSSLLQCEAIKVISDEKSLPYLDKLSNTLSEGMEEIRHAIHDIHDESFDFEVEIDKILSSLNGNIRVNKSIKIVDTLDRKVEGLFLKVLKESITNINKYSDATNLNVVIKELPKHVTLLIKDDGSNENYEKHINLNKKSNSRGIGLKGMKEDTDNLDGNLNYGYKNGFYIHLSIEK